MPSLPKLTSRETYHALNIHHSEEDTSSPPWARPWVPVRWHSVLRCHPSRENLTVSRRMGTAVTEPRQFQNWPASILASTSCIGDHIRCGYRMTDRRSIDWQTDRPMGAAVFLSLSSRTCYSVFVFATVPGVTVMVREQVSRRTGEVTSVRCHLWRTCEAVCESVGSTW